MWDNFISLSNTYGATIKWDTASQSPWFQYSAGGVQHTSWFENASSTEAKLTANNLYGAGGIFIWRFGGEDLGIWNVIRSKFGGIVLPGTPTAQIKAGGFDGSQTIASNTSTIISWTSTNADSCTVSPTGWTGISNTGISTGNLTTTTTYNLSCSGPGGGANDSVVVNVTAPQTGDTTPPTVEITEPAFGDVLSKRIRISVSASDNVEVARVLLYIDDNLFSTDTSLPYVNYWNTQKASPGQHIIKAVAYDAAGNNASTQITVTVK